MDWLTLLLIFIFFVLPLIQQIAEARRRGGAPPPELPEAEEEWEYEEELHPEMGADRGRRDVPDPRSPEGDGKWSEGWGSWPGETPVPAPVPEPSPARNRVPEVRQPQHAEAETARWDRGRDRETVEREVPVRLERPVPAPRPERVLVERVVPVEAVYVDRREEGRRPRERKHALSRPAAGAVRSVSPMAAVLHDSSQLRRALILSEIIGPPRSMRPLEEDQK